MDDREREAAWKAAVSPLVQAYATKGRVALEAMNGVEPLALLSDKSKDYKALGKELEARPGDQELQEGREKLLGEINDITDWINGKLREQLASSRKHSLEEMRQMASERGKAPTKQQ